MDSSPTRVSRSREGFASDRLMGSNSLKVPPDSPFGEGSIGSSLTRSESMTSIGSKSELSMDEMLDDGEHHDAINGESAIMTPLHRQILSVLRSSQKLKPVFVGVRNESYWYYSRKQLSAHRQVKIVTRQHPHTNRWEASVYKMDYNEDIERVPMLKEVTRGHKSKWAAVKKAEHVCKERDMYPGDIPGVDPQCADQLMQTHFKVAVVSEAFYGLSNFQRICMIWEDLLTGLGMPLDPHALSSSSHSGSLLRCPPVGMKLASTWGPHMCSLEVFRAFETRFPLHLIISAKTPSQWRPELYGLSLKEKFGASAVGVTSSAMHTVAHKHADTKAIKNRVSMLAHAHGSSSASSLFGSNNIRGSMIAKQGAVNTNNRRSTVTNANQETGKKRGSVKGKVESFLPPIHPNAAHTDTHADANPLANMSLADTLGLPGLHETMALAAAEGRIGAVPKIGGVFGHFFEDLSPGIRKMVLEKVNENKILIQRAGHNDYYDHPHGDNALDHASVGDSISNHSNRITRYKKMRARRRGHKVIGDYDVGTQGPEEMWEEFQISAKHTEKLVMRLQRIRRMAVLRRASAQVFRYRLACLVVQRICRGWLSRVYVKAYRQLLPQACIRVQLAFRRYRSANLINMWAWAVLRMSRVIVPRLKQFALKCVRRWLKKRNRLVVRIQAMIRMHLARARYFHMIGQLFYNHVITLAAVTIQRVVRGICVRRLFADMCEKEMIARVDIPSATRIQRIYRGYLGRQLAVLQVRCLKICFVIETIVVNQRVDVCSETIEWLFACCKR
jgi:stress-induced morphogen